MQQWGVNVTQDGSDHPPGEVGAWRRIVVSDPYAIKHVIAYRAAGYKVAAVATKQVIQNLGNNTTHTPASFFDRFGMCEAVQVWNEPDGGGPESDGTTRNTFQIWLWAFRDEAKRRAWDGTLLAGGLVSGNPNYLQGIDLTGGYRLALHPYDQKPYYGYPDWGHGDLPSLLEIYTPFKPPGTKFWLTEISRTTDMEPVQARYAKAIVEAITKRPDVEATFWYCYRDWHLGNVPRPFGLLREGGGQKETYGAWTKAIWEAQLAEQVTWDKDKERIEEQIHLLVENQRRILKGDWDEARIFLDAIDPSMKGKWTNVPFPKGGGSGGA